MDRHAAASAAAVLEDGIGQGPDLLQREGGVLRKQADAAFVDGTVEAETA